MITSRLFVFIIICVTMGIGSASASNRQARQLVRKGNALYRSDKRQEAQVDYLKAVRADSTDARALYNLSTSMFPRDWKTTMEARRDTMAAYFTAAAQQETNPLRKAQAYHNQGVLYQSAKQFDKAIASYKNALRNNPHDDESRYNLVLCQRQLKNGGGDNSQQKDKLEEQDKQDQNQQQQQQKEQQQKEQEQQEQQQQQQEPPMSKENAEQLLNAVMQQEKNTQERVQEAQQQPRRRRIEKNW